MGLTPPHLLGEPGRQSEVIAAVMLALLGRVSLRLLRRFPMPVPFRTRHPRRLILRRVAAAVVLAVGTLVLLEGALRLDETLHPPAWRSDPDMFWTLAPGLREVPVANGSGTQTVVSTNELGLRERTIPYQKAPGELRLLCLGDSWTFGQGVAVEQTFARRLQTLLQRRLHGRKVTVINAGQPGFSYFQGYALIQQLMPLYRPDIVLMCGFNEVGNRQIPEMEDSLPDDPLALKLRHLLHQSRVYMLLRKEVARLKPAPREVRAAERSSRAGRQPQTPPPSPRPGRHAGPGPDFDRMLSAAASLRYARGIAQVAREGGARCVFFNHAFVPFSFVPSFGAAHLVPYAAVRFDPVLTGLKEPDLITVSLCPVQTWAQYRRYMQRSDSRHPDVRGHAAMARALLKLLEDSGYLPRDRGPGPAGRPSRR